MEKLSCVIGRGRLVMVSSSWCCTTSEDVRARLCREFSREVIAFLSGREIVNVSVLTLSPVFSPPRARTYFPRSTSPSATLTTTTRT